MKRNTRLTEASVIMTTREHTSKLFGHSTLGTGGQLTTRKIDEMEQEIYKACLKELENPF